MLSKIRNWWADHLTPKHRRLALVLAAGLSAIVLCRSAALVHSDMTRAKLEKEVKQRILTDATPATKQWLTKALHSEPSVWLKHEKHASDLLYHINKEEVFMAAMQPHGATSTIFVALKDGSVFVTTDTMSGRLFDQVLKAAATTPLLTVVPPPPPSENIPILSVVQLLLFSLMIGVMLKDVVNFGNFQVAQKPDTNFDDVIGAREAKAALQDIVAALKQPDQFSKLGAKAPRGVLMAGPPGTGKTLLARAMAGECGASFIAISGASFTDKFIGVGVHRVKALFRKARKHAPCIIFIDEIDGVGRRGHDGSSAAAENNRIINQLLVEIDGFSEDDQVLVIGATNLPEHVDPALRREGRFDRMVTLRLPDVADRESLLRHYGAKVTMAEDIDYPRVSRMTAGLSPAAIATLVNQSALLAARHKLSAIDNATLLEAVDIAHMGEASGALMSEAERIRTAGHEAGHALVAHLLGTGRVEKVTILPRGMALGVTQTSDEEDRHLRTQDELEKRIQMLLGGRGAERVLHGNVSTGAGNDLKVASQLALAMVRQYGFGESLFVLPEGEPLNEQTVKAAKDLLAEMERRCDALLTEHKAALQRITAELLAKETISGEEMEALIS